MSKQSSVFISYRREPSADLARYIYDHLMTLGVDAFFDLEDINGGYFDTRIEREIIQREHFLIILAPTTLESEWVRREVETAFRHNKNIIPLVTRGFSFDQHIPPELAELRRSGGIPHDVASPETTFKRLARALQLSSPTIASTPVATTNTVSSNHRFPVGLSLTIAIVLLVVVGLIAFAPRLFSAVAPTATPTLTASSVPPTNTNTLMPTLDVPTGTATSQSTQPDITSTEILLQPTVDMTQTAKAVPSASSTLEPSNTPLPPTATATSTLIPSTKAPTLQPATATSVPPTIRPTVTPSPTNMLQTSAQPTSASGYPCPATIVDNTGNATILNQIHSEAVYASSPIGSVRVGQAVSVLKKELEGSRTVWYQIGNDQGKAIGYILEDYVRLSPSCPQ